MWLTATPLEVQNWSALFISRRRRRRLDDLFCFSLLAGEYFVGPSDRVRWILFGGVYTCTARPRIARSMTASTHMPTMKPVFSYNSLSLVSSTWGVMMVPFGAVAIKGKRMPEDYGFRLWSFIPPAINHSRRCWKYQLSLSTFPSLRFLQYSQLHQIIKESIFLPSAFVHFAVQRS